jgi:hypothetical protein
MTVDINIYLHGYFFTEAQDDKLVIASPPYTMHKIGYWDDAEMSWRPFPKPFQWIPALRDGGKQDFPDDILHFSRKDLGLSKPFIPPDAGQYGVYIELPLPSDIRSVRDGGDLGEFQMQDGKVAESVTHLCGSNARLSLVTWLLYKSSGVLGFTDINFYAEHCLAPGAADLKGLFEETRKVLPNFDLHLTDLGGGRDLSGPSTDNEKTLCELGPTLKNNPCTDQDCHAIKPMLVRTANCPQFGVQP